jgi:N-acetylglucosamine-6-phosphate deacetylase
VTAGLVDVQVNGAFGVDFARATPNDWVTVSRRLPATGVTAYVPTFITAPVSELGVSLDRTSAAQRAQAATGPQARILGAHLEGPFISELRAGAHDAGLMVDPGPAQLAELLATAERRAVLRIVTLAPERAGALDAIRALAAAGILVSLGHTDADGACASHAADAGARFVTHLFNAMRGLDHRVSSLAGRVLADPRFHVGLIADLHHVDPDLVSLVLRAAPDRAVLVTDAVAAAGLPPGRYQLGGAEVTTTREDPLPRRSDGVLAGSVLRLDEAVRNVAGRGVPLEHAMLAASRNPADALGRTDLGRIEHGALADLVWWSDELEVRQVWVGGHPCLPSPTG